MAAGAPNVTQGTLSTPSGDEVLTVVPIFYRRVRSAYRLAVVAPEQSLTNAWRAALPRLSMAALGALLVSIVIAWWLASTITRPMVQITRASEEMARGNLDPHLTLPETPDEVGRLSKAFTTMAREVARSHRAMRDLLANVSHDLRTPLTSISGFAGALVDGTLSGPKARAKRAGSSARKPSACAGWSRTCCIWAASSRAIWRCEREPVDLADLARAAQARFSFRAQEAASISASTRPSRSESSAIRIASARCSTTWSKTRSSTRPPSGSVAVTARARTAREPLAAAARPAPTAVLTVHNTGSYIPPEEAERVFERFYQVDKARAGARMGAAWGWPSRARSCRRTAVGSTWRATPQDGTSFIVRIPALEPTPAALP